MSIINFTVSVPINTPEEDTIYITGNHDVLNNWEPPGLPLEKTGEKEYNIELDLPEGSEIEFKFTRGTWPSVEGDEDFQEAGSRVYTVDSDEDVYLTVANWVDLVDIEKEILSAGGEYHADCEQLLISNGSSQENLWGGGFRFNNKEVDFMALTNFKPSINHFTYEISLPEIREKVEKTIRKIFDNE